MVHSLEIVVKSRDHDISYPENLEVEKEVLPIHNIPCWCPNPPKGGAGARRETLSPLLV